MRSIRYASVSLSAVRESEMLFNKVHGHDGNKKGCGHERRALQLTHELVIECELQMIVDVYITNKHSQLDCQGIDIVARTDRGEIYLQIKSSVRGVREFKKKRRGCGIPCIRITRDSSDSRIKRDIKHAFLYQYRQKSAEL